MSNESKVKVVDVHSQEVLFECPISKSEDAYKFAAEMEEMGLEVSINSPGVTETLCDSLGIEREARALYEESVVAEIEDHIDDDHESCCTTKTLQ